jgi:hypothetical protein
MKVKKQHSDFWLGEYSSTAGRLGNGLLQLASSRRAVANFVMIMTGKNIPVRFAERSTSFTDGKVVQIGGELADGYFDETVGLALHEGSHIVKSDFGLLKNLWQTIPNAVYDAIGNKLPKSYVADFTKEILNIIEDRYIDAWVYKKAPGYRGYYDALYRKYFFSAKITKALLSDEFREPTLKNYRFRVLNLINPKAPIDAMPGLEDIVEKIDLNNILRLETPKDRVEIAYEVVEIIFKNVVDALNNDGKNSNQSNDAGSDQDGLEDEENSDSSDCDDAGDDAAGETSQGSGNGGDGDIEDLLGGERGSSDHYEEKSDSEKILGEDLTEKAERASEPSNSRTTEFTAAELKAIEKAIQRQVDFTNRELTKKGFTKEMLEKLRVLENSGIDITKVGDNKNITCVYVNKLTKELIQDRENFPYGSFYKCYESAVRAGVQFGTMLGRRLQVRDDVKSTVYNRLENGKIHRRLLNELGYDNENVFYRVVTDKFKKAHLHISVDASSSMDSSWHQTLKTLVSIAKAGSMVKNLGVSITFRSAVKMMGEEVVYVVKAYDSKVDKFNKILQLFPLIGPAGCTPEGLAFEEIIKNVPAPTNDSDTFFVNISDGEPYMTSYFGPAAWNHTRKQVDKMRSVGVEVISYYVENGSRSDINTSAFKTMYGVDANIINTNNVQQVAYTLNKKFSQK